MLIIGTFEYSLEIEEALAELEHNGIVRNNILVVPMDPKTAPLNQFVGKSNDYYSKGIEVGMAVATASSVIGTSVGFILSLGPIIWGLTAAFIGFILGFGLYFIFNRKNHRRLPKRLPEVAVIIKTSERHYGLILNIMWKYDAITIGKAYEES